MADGMNGEYLQSVHSAVLIPVDLGRRTQHKLGSIWSSRWV